MYWFIFGLLLGGVAGFVVCALFTVSRENHTSENFEIKVLGPDPCGHKSGGNEA